MQLKAEKNYCQLRKAALSNIFAVNKFQKYLYGHKFCAVYILLTITSTRLQCCVLLGSGYNYDVQYQNGQDMGNADSL
ncbi:hypothetical protein PR048_017520 [Dryococelus australis]|uniref:Uncharacterized protein n=1 Tax=Dryococelus australis TaxID=614101 RepID=A0ABQ9H9S7_9NEOP|nr:hypothetical protein PR048_017520 [Dryococelus australis]